MVLENKSAYHNLKMDLELYLGTFRDAFFNSFSANFTKWTNTLTQFVGSLPRNCLGVFDHFVGFAIKGLTCQNMLGQKDP